MTTQLISGRIFDGNSLLGMGVVAHQGPTLSSVEVGGSVDGAEVLDLGDALITPGLVDVHSHGGGGGEFGIDPATVLELHRRHGSTTMIASLVTGALDVLEGQVRMLTELVAAGELAGIHLEGPWLAPGKKGAHPLELLRPPGLAEVARLIDAGMLPSGRSAVRMITVAPELAEGLDAVALMAHRGVVAAVGHTEADLDITRDAIEAGATGATHLFNAMPPLLNRAPGPILALAADERVWLELIVDGVHVHPDLVAETIKRYGDRVVLVTDAMAAAGMPDGDYMLGELAVEVCDGIARLTVGGAIAGSTLTLDKAVRTAIAAGVDPWQALRAATSLPARYLDIPGVGALAPGLAANLVVWTDDWQVRGVMRHGEWLVRP